MPMLKRLCSGCRTALIASPARRCTPCQRAYEARRGTTAGRGYGSFAYQRRRGPMLARDGYACHWCGGPATTTDHLVPVSRGGAIIAMRTWWLLASAATTAADDPRRADRDDHGRVRPRGERPSIARRGEQRRDGLLALPGRQPLPAARRSSPARMRGSVASGARVRAMRAKRATVGEGDHFLGDIAGRTGWAASCCERRLPS
jgi:5-methylcytosine-specific restriction endonuclease McrA